MRINTMSNEELVAHVINNDYDNTDRTTMNDLVRELAGRLEDLINQEPWEAEVHGGTEYNG